MTFEVGRLSAALTLDGVDHFHRELDRAGQKLQDTAGRGSSFGKTVADGVRAAAGATTNLVAAAGAYLTVLTKTGISYNSLQQNSRAALSVLLGGAEKANEQMAKLDDFARNSPFSKSVFIQAQQQLIGFGVEASKVVPILDAVQQSVAAMGGSDQQISEIVNILATVNSTGKITANTFNELGYRGIDAAELLGKKWGKTAAQIREDVTDGAIDGREALFALVDAMDDRFGGAADNVKKQWSGAVDRIKAAQRDLGAHLAEPFVSAQGGGMAVTWGNQIADVLRAIEKQAVPVMGILTQRGMPFFASLTQGLDSARGAIQRWNPRQLDDLLDKLGGHAPAISATAGALLAVGAQAGPLGRVLGTLGISANPVVAAFVGLAAASPEVREAFKEVLAAGKPLINVAGDLAVAFSGQLNAALPLVTRGVEVLAGVLGVATRLIEKIPTPVLMGATAFFALHKALGVVEGPLKAVTEAFIRFGQRSQVQAALGGTTAGMGALSTASIGAQGAVKGLGAALKTAFLSNPIGIALTAISTLIGVWAVANANAQQKVQEHNDRVRALKDTLNETSGALTAASKAQVESNLADTEAYQLADKLGIKHREITAAALGNEDAYLRVTAAMEEHIASVSSGDKNLDTWSKTATDARQNVKALTEILEEQSAAVKEAQETKKALIQADRDAAAAMSDAARSNQRFNDALEVARDITKDAETRVRALKQALDELKGGTISAEEAQARLWETSLSLADGLARTDEAGNKLWASMITGTGEIDKSTQAGQDFYRTMERANDQMLNAAMAASDQALANGDLAGAVDAARSAGDNYIQTLRTTMEQAGLTSEQIDALIGHYLDVPSIVATLLTDNGTTSEVDKQVLALAMKLDALPEGESITIDDPGNPDVIKRMEELEIKVEKIPGTKQISISQTGGDILERFLNEITRPRTVWVDVRANDPNNYYGRADGGLHTFGAGNQIIEQFANGGFPTGIFRGGPPIFKFAEPETGWEAFISGRPGQELRNAKIAMDALNRLGFPVVPLSALRGVPAFADGGMRAHAPVHHTAQANHLPAQSVTNLTINNPETRDPFKDMWEQMQGGKDT